MLKKLYILFITLVVVSLSSACSSDSAATTQNLQGNWVGSDMAAVVSERSIEVSFVSDDTRSLYWSGSFFPYIVEGTTLNSERNEEAMRFSITATPVDFKQFTYKDGQLSYDVTMFGVTRTIHLERE